VRRERQAVLLPGRSEGKLSCHVYYYIGKDRISLWISKSFPEDPSKDVQAILMSSVALRLGGTVICDGMSTSMAFNLFPYSTARSKRQVPLRLFSSQEPKLSKN
jgi:hypothetical protein